MHSGLSSVAGRYSRMHRANCLIIRFFLLLLVLSGARFQIPDCAVQKQNKLRFFLRGKTGDDPCFTVIDGFAHGFIAGGTLRKNVNPLAPPVGLVRAEFNEALFLQTGKQTRNGGMTQMKRLLNVPGTGRLDAVSQITHDVPLRAGQFHGGQRVGNCLIGLTVQNPNQMTIM